MVLSLRRWGTRRERIAPADPIRFDAPPRGPAPQYSLAPDDYIVEAESEATGPPMAAQAVRIAQFLLIVVIALLTLAVFWMVGLILGIL